MTAHAKDTLRGSSIAQVFNLSLAVAAAEACSAKGLVASQDGQILNLVAAGAAAICAVVAYKGAIAEEEEVRVGVKEGTAGIATEAVQVPTIASCEIISHEHRGHGRRTRGKHHG